MNNGIHVSFSIFVTSGYMPGEGDGTPLQYSCLETPMDGRAWWASVYGVAQSWTRLSDLAAAVELRHKLNGIEV